MMNEKAIEIGMTSSNFTNSSGINDPDNVSTVRDIAIMSKYLIDNYPIYYELFKEKTFTWDRTGGDPIKQGNRNPLLYKNVGVDGVNGLTKPKTMKRESTKMHQILAIDTIFVQ